MTRPLALTNGGNTNGGNNGGSRRRPPRQRRQGRRRNRRRGGGGGGPRNNAAMVLAQGAGSVPGMPFGSWPSRSTMRAWDAFHPEHLPLPRSVGPYCVVRTSSLITSSDKVMLFAPMVGGAGCWLTACAMGSRTEGGAINGFENTNVYTVPFPGIATTGSGITVVPAALSVQVMNPNPLMSTTGIFGGTVSHTQLNLAGRTETWNDFSMEVISFMRPRLMSAGKLALRGVQGDSYPLNMSALSNFNCLTDVAEGKLSWTDSSGHYPAGLAPIVFVNEAKQTMNYLVSVEWRVRFDIGNPAVAAQRHHGITPEWKWDDMIKTAIARGHGIMDIAERVANAGSFVANAAIAARRAMPALMAA
uniref:Capsid protein n=2 Tax=Heterocapsa circularisquama RNA virus 01 TaxID=2030964 RepID=A0A125T1L8_9VIRU|nr:capsid protein [Heterocapsa circularisquama RNA virus 01]